MSIRKVWEHENEEYRAESLAALRKAFPKGSTVYTVVTHRGRSDTPTASVKIIGHDKNGVYDLSYDAARVMDSQYDDQHGGVYTRGGNLNLAYHLVHFLSLKLHGDGKALNHEAL